MTIEQRRIKGAFAAPTPTLPILEALNNAFVSIRTAHHDVPNVVLVVGPSSQTAYGHFHANQWEGKTVNEIMLSGESLGRNAVDVFGTLLHEAVHAAAHTRNLVDTSRGGRYHNQRFAELCHEFGLEPVKVPGYGWASASVPESTQKVYSTEISLIRKALKTYRVPSALRTPRKKTTIKLQTATGRTLTVPILFHEAGGIFDEVTGEKFLPIGQ